VPDAARQPLEEPHVAHRRRQRDLAQPLAAHLWPASLRRRTCRR
jgi:hypothetical protein